MGLWWTMAEMVVASEMAMIRFSPWWQFGLHRLVISCLDLWHVDYFPSHPCNRKTIWAITNAQSHPLQTDNILKCLNDKASVINAQIILRNLTPNTTALTIKHHWNLCCTFPFHVMSLALPVFSCISRNPWITALLCIIRSPEQLLTQIGWRLEKKTQSIFIWMDDSFIMANLGLNVIFGSELMGGAIHVSIISGTS